MINSNDYYKGIRERKIIPASMICFAFPRSGSTLLMRLLKEACNVSVMGDFDLTFYKSIMDIRNFYRDDGIYGSCLEVDNTFPDKYRGKEINQCLRMVDYHLRNIFLPSAGSCFSKTTILGFGNNLLSDYVDMIRDMYSYDFNPAPLKIVWLTRDKNDCAESLWKKYSTLISASCEDEFKKININLLEEQHKQFKECFELGDVAISYDDLINNTEETLVKLTPSYYPRKDIITKVIGKVLR